MKKNIFFAGILFLLISCSKDSNSDNNGSNNNNTVTMKNSSFSPASLQVNINGTVTWVNDDNTVHTVTANDGSFNSGDMAPGARFTYTFSSIGTISYHCMHHSAMTGAVVIVGIK